MECHNENHNPSDHLLVLTSKMKSVMENIAKKDAKPTVVKRTQSHQYSRVVLKDISKNIPYMTGGGVCTQTAPTTPVSSPSITEAEVQFSREFIEEKQEYPSAIRTKLLSASVTTLNSSTSLEEGASSEALKDSLPDLLPKTAFKKQSETDTDPTEYYSASESVDDSQEALSQGDTPSVDVQNVFEEDLPQNSVTDSEILKTEALSGTTSNSTVHIFEEKERSFGVGDLCVGISKLCLNTPKRNNLEESSDTFSSKSPEFVLQNHQIKFEDCSQLNEAKDVLSETLIKTQEKSEPLQSYSPLVNLISEECSGEECSSVQKTTHNLGNNEEDISVETNIENVISGELSTDTDCIQASTTDSVQGEISGQIAQPSTNASLEREIVERESLLERIVQDLNKEPPTPNFNTFCKNSQPAVCVGLELCSGGDNHSNSFICDENTELVNGNGTITLLNNNSLVSDISTCKDDLVSFDVQSVGGNIRASENINQASPICETSNILNRESVEDHTELSNILEICSLQGKDLNEGLSFSEENVLITSTDNFLVTNSKLIKTYVNDPYDGDIVASEAAKIAEEIFNVSLELDDVDEDFETELKLTDMEEVNPFAVKSALRHSPPRNVSPKSNSRGGSPSFTSKDENLENSLVNVTPKKLNGTFKLDENISQTPNMAGDNSVETLSKTEKIEVQDNLGTLTASVDDTEAGPDIADDSQFQGGDVFKDPSTFDFLSSVGNSFPVRDLRKESLYVKFDPLVGAISKTDNLPNQTKPISTRLETIPGTPEQTRERSNVPVNQALAYIDKLISLSPSPLKPKRLSEGDKTIDQNETVNLDHSQKENKLVETTIEHNYSWNGLPDPGFEQEVMLNELQELRDMVAQQEKTYTEKVNVLEEKVKGLEITLKDKDEKEQKLQNRVSKLSEGQEQINLIMEEYEKTISRLVAEKEQAKQAHELEKENLIKEKDTVAGHLANIEIAFSDLHKKYERSKDVIAGIKKNEEALKTSLAEYEATIKEQEQKYDLLKSYAMSQLESANQELDSMRRSHQAENAKSNAMLKKSEVKVKSLEEMLEQKVKENEELASICDELISKVGSGD